MKDLKNMVGLEVYCKRNGATGVVTAQDALSLVIESSGISKTVTYSTFQRWYTIVPQENKEEQKVSSTEEQVKSSPQSSRRKVSSEKIIQEEKPTPSSENSTDTGVAIREKFINLVKEVAVNGELDITVNEKNHTDVIKYNGYNVFECSFAKTRYNVLCHPNSLTPGNLKRADKVFPKEWGWALRAKFVFTALTQWPLMKTIITDGLFYRQTED